MIQHISLSPAQVLDVLRAGHVGQLPHDTLRTIAARAVAGSASHAACRLFISPRAFRDHLSDAESLILIPLGLERDVAYLMLWFGFHEPCCAAEGWRLMKTSAVFPAEMT